MQSYRRTAGNTHPTPEHVRSSIVYLDSTRIPWDGKAVLAAGAPEEPLASTAGPTRQEQLEAIHPVAGHATATATLDSLLGDWFASGGPI